MSTISSATNGSAAPSAASSLHSDQISMQQFMQLLVTQLQNQNPLDPMSDADFFAQMAQLGQVQGMDNLQQASELQQAQGYLGKSVTAITSGSTAQLISGTVTQISLQNGAYQLTVTTPAGNPYTVGLGSIQSVALPGG